MLPLINYVPDSLALVMARRFSKRIKPNETWDELLRKGIRGATEGGISNILGKTNSPPEMLNPKYNGLRDRIDLYYLNTNSQKLKSLKTVAKIFIKMIKIITGITLVPDLSLAFRKHPDKSL